MPSLGVGPRPEGHGYGRYTRPSPVGAVSVAVTPSLVKKLR